MALEKWGFIYLLGDDPIAEPRQDLLGPTRCRLVAVGVPTPGQAPEVAKRLVAQGVQLIELCGAFGPVWTARVIEAIDGAVPVGSVGYGAEAIEQLHRLFGVEH